MSIPKKLRELRRRFLFYLRKDRFDRELEDEISFHLEMKAMARMLDGMQPAQARLAARRQFGNETRLKERSREMWSFRWIEGAIRDLHYTWRIARKSPVFASVIILSLALAIGANTAIFSIVDAVLLKTLPVKNPNELVLFGWSGGDHTYMLGHSGNMAKDPKTGLMLGSSLSVPMFERMRQQNQTLTDLFAFARAHRNLNVSIDNRAEIATGQFVSGSYYQGLGVDPVIGRTITDDDDNPRAAPVAVITYRYWKERFGLDPAILDKPAFINGLPFNIVGVSPPGFDGALGIVRSIDVSVPLSTEPLISHGSSEYTDETWNCWLRVMGRLKPGATTAQARANFEPLVQQCAMDDLREYLAKFPSEEFANPVPPTLTAISGSQGDMFDRRDYSEQLYMLLIIVGLVLLIACVNVANLLLARSGARQKEIAARIALGAGRFRLIRQLLTESLFLALAGGVAGFILAYWAKGFLGAVSLLRGLPLYVDMSLDLRVLGFAAAVSVATGMIFGIAPAVKATSIEPGPALKENAPSGSLGRSPLSLGKSLIVLQVALSIVLLVGAGVFLRTLRNLQNVDYGFDARSVLLFDVNPSLNGYKGERLGNIYQQIAERLEAIPGVKSSTISLYPLMKGWGWGQGMPKAPGASKVPPPQNYFSFPVRNNFFEAMHIPLLFGRGFDDRDNANSPKVAIVNQAFVRLVFDDDMPIGQHFEFDNSPNGKLVFEVVGIAKDTIYKDLRKAPQPIVYYPFQQQLRELDRMGEGMTYEVRASGDPIALVPAVREAVRSIDSKLPILNVKTQTEQIDERLSRERVLASMTVALGVLVLILAGLGLYGVMQYNVTRRTREIGIRMALGAGTRKVLGQVMRETLVLVAVGIVSGVAASYAVTQLISAAWIGIDARTPLLFGVTPHDPLSLALATFFLLAVAAIAGYLPARKAARVDPILALRYD
jgi:predicted permease